MGRLPYGTFKNLTPEQQREHLRQLAKRFRTRHREQLNARNARYMRLWMKTKPFIVQCKYCGNDFNAPRRDRHVCPNCHQKAHEHAESIKTGLIARRNAKAYLMDKVVELHNKGLLQTEIARELNLSQRNVSNYLLKMGIRTQKYYPRRK